jgi:hypothetical protein
MKKNNNLIVLLALLVVSALLFASVPASAGSSPGHEKSLVEARRALEQELLPLARAGFVGIAHSESNAEITVFVENEQAKQRVPRSFQGYKVRTEVTGKVEAFSTQVAEPLAEVSAQRKQKVRPLVGGTSLSAYVTKGAGIYLYAGTLGMITYNNKILSNAHVIAMNPETSEFLNPGTAIIQPGSGDGGRLRDKVGSLEAYIPIDFTPGATNYADAAIGSVDSGVNASAGEQFSEAGDYWIEGWTEVSIGDTVRKSGRTSGVTTGEVAHTNVSIVVWYGDRSAYFADQIAVAQDNWSFVAPGDSGSAVDKDGKFVGLVFAGSENYAFICKAEHIINGLGIAVEPPEGRYSLTISSTPGGSVTSPGEGMFLYDEGTVVNLVAEADEHYHFVEWTGDVATIDDVSAASTNITVNGSYKITAKFELDEGWCSLTISSTAGGSVTTPGEGTFVYAVNQAVGLFARASEHYHFTEWTGNVSTVGNVTAASTYITMNDSYSIIANFELDEGYHSLTVSSTEGGSVTQPGEGTFIYPTDTVVNLVAKPDEGHQFLKWTGDVVTVADIYAASTTITMNASYSVTANFQTWQPEPATLLTVSSTEGGSVTEPGEGTFLYPVGAKVDLVAVPDEGYHFTRWLGDVDTISDIYAASTTITMDTSYSVTAGFSTTGLCVVTTAAYGTPMAEEIQLLREFRDRYLLTNLLGKSVTDLYYRVSPPMARLISEHPSLKPIVRAGLWPAITLAKIAMGIAAT